MIDGILLVDKPSGWTSFDVVAKVRGILRADMRAKIELSEQSNGQKKVKVGHTGTLDPLATGLLVLVLGNYCKRAQEFSKLDKIYEVTIKLGQTSTTGDEEGEKQQICEDVPTKEQVTAVLSQFKGDIMQTPPAYSAIKINGQRAYKLAREGKDVTIEPRPVHINDITDITYKYPGIKFTAEVSSGTYIRSLATDIGNQLETGAYMSDLRRTRVGTFDIAQAISLTDIDMQIVSNNVFMV
ncbi:MAG: tRNA pseudouridine(55) synthase TruB [Candidatus Saccharimonadales bacterium]